MDGCRCLAQAIRPGKHGAGMARESSWRASAGSDWVSLGLASKVTAGRLVRAEQIEVVVGLGCPGVQQADGTPALCPAMARISWRWSTLEMVPKQLPWAQPRHCFSEHRACRQLAALHQRCAASVPLCAALHLCAPECPVHLCACMCICVHACACVHLCACMCACACVHLCACVCPMHPCVLCASVHLCALCAHVHHVPTCICPVHPCARGCLRWPLWQCLLPSLAWGSALGTALSRSRLIPSRCGCWEPSSVPPPRRGPHRFLVHGCRSRWSRQSSRLPGSCIAAGLFTARSSWLCSSAAAILPAVSALACADPGAASD